MARCKLRGWAAIAFLLPAVAVPPIAQAGGLSKAEVAKRGKAATVLVIAKAGTGSGFCVHSSGLLITNEHVVGSDAEVTVVFHASLKNQQALIAKVLRTDKQLDLALLQVDGQKDLPALTLGTIDKVTELAEVVVCGFPFGKNLAAKKDTYPAMTINAGSITALRMKVGALHEFQMDVEINPGNSGGPVLDMSGQVVGVVVGRIVNARANFAIPVTQVVKFVDKPDIVFTGPAITRQNAEEPVEFQARLASVLPSPRPLSLELVLQAGAGPERRFKMELKDGVFRASAVPLPREKIRRLELSAQFEAGSVEGIIEDGEFQVGAQNIQWNACKRIQCQPTATVFLANGKSLTGALTGLDKVAVQIGGQSLIVNLSRVTSLQVQAPHPPAAVECTLIARRDHVEVGRLQRRIAIRGVTLVEPADLAGASIRPPTFAAEKIVKTLPDIAADICVGGGGRYLILHVPKLKKLAIFDVNEAAITRYIPLLDDKIVYAAGLDKIVVGLASKGIIERWDLASGKKELTRPILDGADLTRVLMGSASRGPVVVNSGLFDLQTLKLLPIKAPHGVPAPWSPVSADGTVFGAWKSNQSPTETTSFVLQGDELLRYNEGGTGHIVPGPDGRSVYTTNGPLTNQLRSFGGAPAKAGYCLPAAQGNYYLSLTPAERNGGGRIKIYLLGNEQPLVRDAGFDHGIHFDGWDRTTFGPWKRIFFIPRAKLFVIFPEGNDRLELHRFDVDDALDKAGFDYLVVTSQPPATARRGAEFTYQVVAKSKRGDVKLQLSSGPDGLEVSSTGLVKWRVPADAKDNTSDVILTVRDASGQEIFHVFTIRLTDG